MKQELLNRGYRIFLEKPEFLTIRAKKGADVVDFVMCP